jgi:hypothetical protein
MTVIQYEGMSLVAETPHMIGRSSAAKHKQQAEAG